MRHDELEDKKEICCFLQLMDKDYHNFLAVYWERQRWQWGLTDHFSQQFTQVVLGRDRGYLFYTFLVNQILVTYNWLIRKKSLTAFWKIVRYANVNINSYQCSWCADKTKKAFREMKTLRAGCSKVEPKNFAPPQTPFPGAQDGQNLISWKWLLPLPTNPVWWGSMHALYFELSW